MFFSASSPAFTRRREFTTARHPLHTLFDEARRSHNSPLSGPVEQDATSVTLRFDVPGISREQLSIGIEGNVVRIQSKDGAPRHYRAAYELPTEIDLATSDAKLENGVLTVKLGRLQPVSKVTELAVH
jgi:HSP20 family protein